LAPAAKADDDGSIWKGDAAEDAMTIMAMMGANNFDGFGLLKCTDSGDDVMVIFSVVIECRVSPRLLRLHYYYYYYVPYSQGHKHHRGISNIR